MAYTNSKAQAGRGTQLSIGPLAGTSSPTYVLIGEVKNVNESGAQWSFDETSNMQSAQYKEWLQTMIDSGTLSITVNRVSGEAGQLAVRAAFLAGGLYMFKKQYPINPLATPPQTTTGDALLLTAYVESMDSSEEVTKANTSTIKLKLSGSFTDVAGS